MPIFRTRLGQVMEKRGIGQRELARRLDRDPKAINLTVIGQHKPDLLMLKGIAEELNISLDWLFDLGRKPKLDEENRQNPAVALQLNGDSRMVLSFPEAMMSRLFGSDLKDIHLISVDSQDMAPTFLEGDLVFLKKTGFQNKSGVYLLRTGKTNVVRRLGFDAVSDKLVVSRDSHPEEKHQTTPDKINVIGQIFRLTCAQ